MSKLSTTRERASLRRSFRLLRSFSHEQTEPALFYAPLAQDTRELIQSLVQDISGSSLEGKTVLDIGGGPGYFADEFASKGAHYISIEPDVGEMSAAGISVANSVRGDGMNLPIRSDSVDIAYSSNVAEHVSDPWRMGEEMLRVTKPGGLTILSYTIWLGPFGGHETGLLPHYIGGEYARDRYTEIHGRPPKNVFGTSLFDVSCSEGIAWARKTASTPHVELCALFPRYHPSWAWWMVHVPILREFLVSNLVIVLRKK